jgi:hypothetical protein
LKPFFIFLNFFFNFFLNWLQVPRLPSRDHGHVADDGRTRDGCEEHSDGDLADEMDAVKEDKNVQRSERRDDDHGFHVGVELTLAAKRRKRREEEAHGDVHAILADPEPKMKRK